MKMWKVYDNANENDNDGQRIYFDPEKLTWAKGSSELKSFRLNKKHQGTWDIIVVISNCCGLRFLWFWSINVKTDGCRIMVIREVHARWAKIHVLFLAFHVSIPENPIKELFWFRLQKCYVCQYLLRSMETKRVILLGIFIAVKRRLQDSSGKHCQIESRNVNVKLKNTYVLI